jgi:hypothetical protein
MHQWSSVEAIKQMEMAESTGCGYRLCLAEIILEYVSLLSENYAEKEI